MTTLVYKAHGSIRYDSYEEVQLCGRVVERRPDRSPCGALRAASPRHRVEKVRYSMLPFAHTPPTQ